MLDSDQEVVSQVAQLFGAYQGPASPTFPTSGKWYEWEGKDIEEALLNLDPVDLRYEDLFIWERPLWSCMTTEGLLWLVPGLVRVIFEEVERAGDQLLQDLFSVLQGRLGNGDLQLSPRQAKSLLNVYDVFYGREIFWRGPQHEQHPFCQSLDGLVD